MMRTPAELSEEETGVGVVLQLLLPERHCWVRSPSTAYSRGLAMALMLKMLTDAFS